MPATYTPVRYPGGKTKIYPTVDSIIEANGLEGCAYAEAFCGGCGLAIKLLVRERVSRLLLNDIDPAVYSMWDVIVNRPDELCRFISEVPLTVEEWRTHHGRLLEADAPSPGLGKSAFYLNRTNRSGILRGGPIGGKGQTGRYGIGARFNRKNLCEKIRKISSHAENIRIYNMDASRFIDDVLANETGQVFANFDPPYVEKGPGLYANSFTESDHKALAQKISSCAFPWIVTYDAVPLVDRAYERFDRYDLVIGYSAATSKVGREILVTGPGVEMPEGLLPRRKDARQDEEQGISAEEGVPDPDRMSAIPEA
ncbi:MAG: DNA adenine methylase [Olsenella sp.]|nr:DNA adenine methylase [Olsenella sp.]